MWNRVVEQAPKRQECLSRKPTLVVEYNQQHGIQETLQKGSETFLWFG